MGAVGCRSRVVAAGLTVMMLTSTWVVARPGIAYAVPRPPTFAVHVDYSTNGSANPTHASVAVADVNGDGIPDLIAPNFGVNTVSILLGVGNGTFGAPSTVATGDAPGSVAVTDVNGDNVVDLVVANTWGDTLSVLLGNGDGTFGARTDFAAGDAPWGIAVGDLNGDDKADVVVANNYANTVSVLLGNGDGTFGAPTPFATGSAPSGKTAIGDFNGDAILDLAVADLGSNTVSVLLGRGDGTFAPRTDLVTGTNPVAVATKDFNGDGALDLATADSTSPGKVSVLFGNGDGTFVAHKDLAVGSAGAMSLEVADLNGDAIPDIAADTTSDQVQVLDGKGDGTFAAPTGFGTGSSPWGMDLGDLNGDGAVDIVTDNFDPTLSVLLNSTSAPTLPDAPSSGTAVPRYQSASLSWAEPADGGSRITGYVVTPYTGSSPGPAQTFNSTATTQVVTNLTDGVTYSFTVAAINAIGTGPESARSNQIAPGLTAPDAPTIQRSATAGDQSAMLSWNVPLYDGGSPIVGYVVTAYVGYAPVKVRIFNSPSTIQTVTGLTNGTEYRFRVRAYTAIGVSDFSKVTNPVTPSVQSP